ncbi:uncharacterized protein BKCO1_3200098 [Diplodia corticola]|uniref:YMC020W-like alpha/beta hydrolase domain-containing protein n=1 Tax=Diplodia corticola TaxID=236234 RepID=A0A1J9QXU6_9PEZI|nr:uncharacterized protein BKCO1_3200098 [Diplodia corticola]OJD33193.1 hypothetical protein BKCO1_3200098 [Diplodia corticola]
MPEDSKRRLPFLDRLADRALMGPRKKSKPSPQAPQPDKSATQQPGTPDTSPKTPNAHTKNDSDKPTEAAEPANNQPSQSGDARSPGNPKGVAPRSSWYAGGSWRAKAAPIAQVARESISSAAGGVTSDSSSDVSKPDSVNKTPIKFLDRRTSTKSTALAASTTNVIATSSLASDSKASLVSEPKEALKEAEIDPPLPPDPTKDNDKTGAMTTERVEPEPEQKTQEQKASDQNATGLTSYIPSISKGLYSWWSRPDGYASGDDKGADKGDVDMEDAKSTPLPSTTPTEDSANPHDQQNQDGGAQTDTVSDQAPVSEATSKEGVDEKAAPTKSSWFWLWSSTQSAQQTANIVAETPQQPEATTQSEGGEQDSTKQDQTGDETQDQTKEPSPNETKPPVQSIPKTSAGWAFWSRANPHNDECSDTESTHKQIGELAVADTPSQSHPEAAQFNEREEEQPPKAPAKSIVGSIRRGRGKGREIDSRPSTPATPSTPSKPTPDQSPTRKTVQEAPAKKSSQEGVKAKQPQQEQANPNLLLPEFKSTYRLPQTPSYWGKVRKYFLGGHEPESPHLQRAKEFPRIKKALAIGVHGYFPAAILQKVLGQPTGTSIRFANAAASAIQGWTESQGYSCEIETVALEGEGYVADRVDTLWKLLVNWIEHVKTADFILVACHSQGVPVAIMLVAKLIQFGFVNAARIGVCAMAGVNLGPFPEYRSRFFGGSAGELFEFSRPDSLVSQKYQGALRVVLNYGVRIMYVGSIDDQLVSLESSIFSNISHPYIYRAVFVDGRIHAPDFIVHLVGFALKLRNLGLPDHGLIRELSPALAGSLYGGEGHSRLYNDVNVYSLAVQHALETTSLPGAMNPGLQIKEYEGTGSTGSNPYFLPWAMRGLLEEDFVRRELSNEVEGLLAMFESWKPTTKPLKDIKFRLEVVKSKL